MINEEQAQKNRDKYGEKQFDVISESYRVGKKEGDIYCGFNAMKYIKRYVGKNYKSENKGDLVKAIDYLTRMLEMATDQENKEIIDK